MSKTKAAIKAITSYLPVAELTNEQLAEEFGDVEANVIWERTGIKVRRVASPDECASDLGVAAARHLFESGASSPEEIDFLLLCTQSPDYFLPATACLMQTQLGLRTDCGAIDFDAMRPLQCPVSPLRVGRGSEGNGIAVEMQCRE